MELLSYRVMKRFLVNGYSITTEFFHLRSRQLPDWESLIYAVDNIDGEGLFSLGNLKRATSNSKLLYIV